MTEYRREDWRACWEARPGSCCSVWPMNRQHNSQHRRPSGPHPEPEESPEKYLNAWPASNLGTLFSSARPGARSGDPRARGPFRAAGRSEHLSFPAQGSPLRGRGSLLPQLSVFRQASHARHPLFSGILPGLDPYHKRHRASTVRAALRPLQRPPPSSPHLHPGAHGQPPFGSGSTASPPCWSRRESYPLSPEV